MLRDLGREDARKRGCPLPDTERVLVFVPFYHASELSSTRINTNGSALTLYFVHNSGTATLRF